MTQFVVTCTREDQIGRGFGLGGVEMDLEFIFGVRGHAELVEEEANARYIDKVEHP